MSVGRSLLTAGLDADLPCVALHQRLAAGCSVAEGRRPGSVERGNDQPVIQSHDVIRLIALCVVCADTPPTYITHHLSTTAVLLGVQIRFIIIARLLFTHL